MAFRRRRFSRRPRGRVSRARRSIKSRGRRLRTKAPSRRHPGRIIMRNVGQPFPNSFFCKLKYEEIISGDSDLGQWSNTAAAPPHTDVVRWASDLNFPRGAADPGQPRVQYYNQMAALYRQYRVLGSKIQIELIPRLTPQANDPIDGADTFYAPSGDYYPVDVCVTPYRQGAVVPGNLLEAAAQPMSRRITYTSANKNRPIKSYVSSKRMARMFTDVPGSNAVTSRWRSFEESEDILSLSTPGPHWFWHIMLSNPGRTDLGWAIRVRFTQYIQCNQFRYLDLSYEPGGEGLMAPEQRRAWEDLIKTTTKTEPEPQATASAQQED